MKNLFLTIFSKKKNQPLKNSNEIYHGSDLFLMSCNILHVMHKAFLDFLYFQILEETCKQGIDPGRQLLVLF